jgi:hypothetical protein
MIARIYATLGQKDTAFAWLERAYRVRSRILIPIRVDPMLDPLRADPRFARLVARVRPSS